MRLSLRVMVLLTSHVARSRPVCDDVSPTSVCIRQEEHDLRRAQQHVRTWRIPQNGNTENNDVSKDLHTGMFRHVTFPDVAYAWFPESPPVSCCQGAWACCFAIHTPMGWPIDRPMHRVCIGLQCWCAYPVRRPIHWPT